MYKFYNPHPQQKIVSDCVKRAITKASGKTYQEVSNELNRIKRAQGARAYNSNSVWREYIEKNLCGKKMSFPAEKGKPRMNGARFCTAYPKGIYIMNMAGHLSCCYNGVIYDTWDCSEKCVYTAYEINALTVTPGFTVSENHPQDKEVRAASKGKQLITGESIILESSKVVNTKIKYTKKLEPWIPLTPFNYDKLSHHLMNKKEYKHLSWEVKRGGSKTIIKDNKTGMTLVLKSGANPYIWCTNNGKGKES